MDAFEFSSLPEEFAAPAEALPPPPEHLPPPEEFPLLRQAMAEPRKERSVLKKLMLLSAALVTGGMMLGAPAAEPVVAENAQYLDGLSTRYRYTVSGNVLDYEMVVTFPEDSGIERHLQVAEQGFSIYWFDEDSDGTDVPLANADLEDPQVTVSESGQAFTFVYHGDAGLDTAPPGATHYVYMLEMVDPVADQRLSAWADREALASAEKGSGSDMIGTEIQPLPEELPYYPREYTVIPLGDRELRIRVIDNGNLDFEYSPAGEFLGTKDRILLEAAMAEREFTDMELPLPEVPEGFTFLGYVMHAMGGTEEDPASYTEFVGTELTIEQVTHAPILSWTDDETGEVREGRILELIGMWLCGEEEDQYLLTLDANGGEYPEDENGEHATEASYSVRSPLYSSTMCWTGAFPEPVRRGFRFTGWYRTPDCEGEPVEVVYGDEFYPMTEPVPGAMTSVEEFDAQYDFTADDFDWDAYYTAYGEFLSALGGRDWSTVIPVTLYAGWEKVDPQLSSP